MPRDDENDDGSQIGELEARKWRTEEVVMNNPADMISQAEKRKILFEERGLSTYRQHADANADLELGGRFAKLTPTTVIGSTATHQYPRQPETSPSNQAAMVGDEPPLGYSVNDQEPVGEKFEVAQASSVAGPKQARGFRRRM